MAEYDGPTGMPPHPRVIDGMMKQPMVAVRIPDDAGMRERILSGKQTAIILPHRHDYKECSALALCDNRKLWCVFAWTEKVLDVLVRGVAKPEWRAAGYKTFEAMMSDLMTLDPDIAAKSPITVIYWRDIRGELVDAYRAKHNAPPDQSQRCV